MPKQTITLKSVLFAFLGVVIALPLHASAHATPLSYEPDPTGHLLTAPSRIRIHFSERVDLGGSSIVVFTPRGESAKISAPSLDPEDPHFYEVDLNESEAGTYAVSWQVISADDGHFTKGAFSFSVGTPTAEIAPLGTVIIHSSTIPEAFSIFLELFGESLLLAALILSFVDKKNVHSSHLGSVHLNLFGGTLALLGSLGYFVVKATDLKVFGVAHPFEALFTTQTAIFTLYRIFFVCVYLVCLWTLKRKNLDASKKGAFLLVGILVLIAFLRARVSHAAASSFFPWLSVGINAIHLLSKEFLVGGAVIIALIAYRNRFALYAVTGSFLRSFSRLAAYALAIGGATGAYIVWLHLKGFENLSTEWGMRSLWLLVLTLVFLVIRFANARDADSPRLHRLILEAGLAILVLLSSSLLIITTPPLEHKAGFERESMQGDIHALFTIHPANRNQFLITAHTDKRITGIVATLQEEEKNIGPLLAPVVQITENTFAFPKNILSPQGVWKIDITLRREGAYDANFSFVVDYPKEVETIVSEPPRVTLDGFTLAMLFVALGSLLLGTIFYRRATE